MLIALRARRGQHQRRHVARRSRRRRYGGRGLSSQDGSAQKLRLLTRMRPDWKLRNTPQDGAQASLQRRRAGLPALRSGVTCSPAETRALRRPTRSLPARRGRSATRRSRRRGDSASRDASPPRTDPRRDATSGVSRPPSTPSRSAGVFTSPGEPRSSHGTRRGSRTRRPSSGTAPHADGEEQRVGARRRRTRRRRSPAPSCQAAITRSTASGESRPVREHDHRGLDVSQLPEAAAERRAGAPLPVGAVDKRAAVSRARARRPPRRCPRPGSPPAPRARSGSSRRCFGEPKRARHRRRARPRRCSRFLDRDRSIDDPLGRLLGAVAELADPLDDVQAVVTLPTIA